MRALRQWETGEPLAATPKFEVKRPGASGHSNDCMNVPFSGYSASYFAGAAPCVGAMAEAPGEGISR